MTGESLVGLPERLRERLADLEAVARAAIERSGTADWAANPYGNVMPADPGGNDWLAVAPYAGDLGDVGVHIAAHDPATVLRTIQAHRKIIELHPPQEDEGWEPGPDLCYVCRYDNGLDREVYPCETVRALASIYFPESDG